MALQMPNVTVVEGLVDGKVEKEAVVKCLSLERAVSGETIEMFGGMLGFGKSQSIDPRVEISTCTYQRIQRI